jgi:3-methylfumaryl-CoA hydratase
MAGPPIDLAHDTADPTRIAGLAALLDHRSPPWRPGQLPPLGHWLCFPPQARQSALGVDGHPATTGALPDTAGLPRRMWAGSRVRFVGNVPLGAALVRRSVLLSSVPKAGRSGRLQLVTLGHTIENEHGETVIVEEQDLVYREATPAAPASAPQTMVAAPAEGVRRVVPDAVTLFRFSALTFNAHRIHYDRDYAVMVEGYRELVVQGPLAATLLLDAAMRRRPGWSPAAFEFRAVAPAFAGEPLDLRATARADAFDLEACNAAGTCITARAR